MDAFSHFLRQIREEVEALDEHPDQLVHHIAAALDELLNTEQLDFHSTAESGLHHGELLYQDTRTNFVVVLMTWGAAAETQIHCHSSWDVFGVLKGTLEVENYVRSADGDELVAQFDARLGDVTYLLPPEQSIHRIRNPGEEVAISLHVYGHEADF